MPIDCIKTGIYFSFGKPTIKGGLELSKTFLYGENHLTSFAASSQNFSGFVIDALYKLSYLLLNFSPLLLSLFNSKPKDM